MPETPALSPARRRATTLYALTSDTQKPLDHDVAAYLDQKLSWRAIAELVRSNTAGEVELAHETLRSWYGPGKAVA